MPLCLMLRRTSKPYQKGELSIKFRSHVAMPWLDLVCQDLPFFILRVYILTSAYIEHRNPDYDELWNLINFFRVRVSSTTIIFLIKNVLSIIAHIKHLIHGHKRKNCPSENCDLHID